MLDIYPKFTRLLDTNDNDTLGFFSPQITSSSPIIHRPRRTQGINLERIYRSVKAAPFPEQSSLGPRRGNIRTIGAGVDVAMLASRSSILTMKKRTLSGNPIP